MNWSDYVRYDESTGKLFWLRRDEGEFDFPARGRWWNRNYAGKEAGVERKRKGKFRHAVQLAFKGNLILAHRIIWEMQNGPIPSGASIDHIDGDPWNNRLSNLRLATHGQNCCNRLGLSKTKSKLKGVRPTGSKWSARIAYQRKGIHLGTFDTKGLAAVAYAKAAMRYHGAFARVV